VGADGTEYGEDEVDPLRWRETSHLLAGPSHTAALRVLDEFLAARAERLVTDPLARAVFQHDLWTIFDWAAGSDRGTAAARRALCARLARILRRVALSRAEIDRLPDTYAAAVASRTFPDRRDGRRSVRAFLPADLFSATGAWTDIRRTYLAFLTGPGPEPIAHNHAFESSRSTFSVLLSVPDGRDATQSYLRTLWEFPQPYVPDLVIPAHGEQRVGLNPKLPRFPVGTGIALARKMLLVDNTGQIVPTKITEMVQLRMFVSDAVEHDVRNFSRDQEFFEFRMSRRLLLAGSSGGLRAVAPDETGFITFSAMGMDIFEGRSFTGPGRVVLDGCRNCHAEPNIHSVRSVVRLLKPYAYIDYRIAGEQFEFGADLKARRPDWALLQQLWQLQPR
jgi:hypothetical protein